jgi:hypothetical protein
MIVQVLYLVIIYLWDCVWDCSTGFVSVHVLIGSTSMCVDVHECVFEIGVRLSLCLSCALISSRSDSVSTMPVDVCNPFLSFLSHALQDNFFFALSIIFYPLSLIFGFFPMALVVIVFFGLLLKHLNE